MARRKRSKSALIRQALAELGPEASNYDVVEHLAARGVKVRVQLVSTVRVRVAAAPTEARGPERPGKAASTESVSLDALLRAKQLVTDAGSVDEAKRTLDALAQLV